MKELNLFCAMACVLSLTCGCLTSGPGSDRIASIAVKSATVSEVRKAVLSVFGEEHYKSVSQTDDGIVFEREGNRDDRLRYGQYQQELIMQVDVKITPLGEMDCFVEADAYALRGSSRRPDKILYLARRPYQQLLVKVRDRVRETNVTDP